MNGTRFDALTRSLAIHGATWQAIRPGNSPPASTVAPAFAVPNLVGHMISRDDVLRANMPAILCFVHPACGPCYEVLPNVAGWQRVYADRVTILLVSSGGPALNRTMIADEDLSPETVILQADRELAVAFGVQKAPAGVLIHANGSLVGEPAYGAQPIRQLVATTLGLALRAEPQRAMPPAIIGRPLPSLRRPTIDGDIVDLRDPRGMPALLFFVSPGCQHCQMVLPDIQRWEMHNVGIRLFVVSRGPVGLNRQMGLRSPMLLDDDHSLADAFGVAGTPAAVLVDADGVLASSVVRGAQAVRSFGAQVLEQQAMPL